MKLIAGLGNPGAKYETTRHNVGFLAVDRLIDHWKATGPSSKFKGELYQASFEGQPVILVKPKTFMNLSGQCLGPLFGFYQCQPEDLIVIHDDLALPPQSIRLKTGGGTGGHNGLKSIDECLGSDRNQYHRVRIGIGHPASLLLPSLHAKMSPADYVLQPFSDEELKPLDDVLEKVTHAVEAILKGQIQMAMNKFHRS